MNKNPLLPWQSITLFWSLLTFLILLLVTFVLLILLPQKKLLVIFRYLFSAFVALLIFINVVSISFLVDVELGWKLSLVAAASSIVSNISILVAAIELFKNMPSKKFWILTVLSVLSFAPAGVLVMTSLGYR